MLEDVEIALDLHKIDKKQIMEQLRNPDSDLELSITD